MKDVFGANGGLYFVGRLPAHRPMYQLIVTSQNTHSNPKMHWDTHMADGRVSPGWRLGWQGPKGGTDIEVLMSYAHTKPEHLDLPCVQQAEPTP